MRRRTRGDRSELEKRRLPQHWAAVQEIPVWLESLMGRDGSVVSVDNSPEADDIEIAVRYLGDRRLLTFRGASAWSEIEPRDELMVKVKAELDERAGQDWFPLWAYAETCETLARRPE
jgi:hypothetical protein